MSKKSILILLVFFVSLFISVNKKFRESIFLSLRAQLTQTDHSQFKSTTNILPVKTQAVEKIDSYSVLQTYSGTVVTPRTSELGFERSGTLINLSVDQGMQVKLGDTLGYLDTQQLEAQQKLLQAKRNQEVIKLKELQIGPRPETIAAAKAKLNQAQAQFEELIAGPRPETIAVANARVKQLKEELELLRVKQKRRELLFSEGAISREQLNEASTAVISAQAELEQANSQLKELLIGTRAEQIKAQKARIEETQSQLDELLAGTRSEQIQAQQAYIEQLDAEIEQLKIELDKSYLRAPFSGIIAQRYQDKGTVVNPGQPVVRLIDNQEIEVHIGLPVDLSREMPKNTTQKVIIGEKTYLAHLKSILPELDSRSRTATVIFTVNNAQQVYSGQIVHLQIKQTIFSSGYWLPTSGLVEGYRGLWSYYVFGNSQDNQKTFPVEIREIEILHIEEDKVFVRGTFKQNERAIVDGIHRLVPGQIVSPIN